MVDVKQAVNTAATYLTELYDASTLGDVMLEEVELSEAEREWHVTLGFQRLSKVKIGNFEPLIPLRPSREYKTFTINAETGVVKSMRIRQLQ
jgi:hypothetical protein